MHNPPSTASLSSPRIFHTSGQAPRRRARLRRHRRRPSPPELSHWEILLPPCPRRGGQVCLKFLLSVFLFPLFAPVSAGAPSEPFLPDWHRPPASPALPPPPRGVSPARRPNSWCDGLFSVRMYLLSFHCRCRKDGTDCKFPF